MNRYGGMVEPKIIIGGEEQRPRAERRVAAPERVWLLAAVLGGLFVVASLIDVGIGLVPVDWSLPIGRFSGVSAAAAALPMLTVGAALLCVSGLMTGSGTRLRLGGVLSALLFLAVVVGLVVMAGSWDGAIASIVEAGKQEARDRLLRASVFMTLFGVALGFCSVLSLRGVAKMSPSVE